jgi:hypothetical protein
MTFRNTLEVTARRAPFALIVEPWADEFTIAVGDMCRIVARHAAAVPSIGVELCPGVLVVWIGAGGATYEFWRGSVQEFCNPIPIPTFPPNRDEGGTA